MAASSRVSWSVDTAFLVRSRLLAGAGERPAWWVGREGPLCTAWAYGGRLAVAEELAAPVGGVASLQGARTARPDQVLRWRFHGGTGPSAGAGCSAEADGPDGGDCPEGELDPLQKRLCRGLTPKRLGSAGASGLGVRWCGEADGFKGAVAIGAAGRGPPLSGVIGAKTARLPASVAGAAVPGGPDLELVPGIGVSGARVGSDRSCTG